MAGLGSQLTGIGAGGHGLQKLLIEAQVSKGAPKKVWALFNPGEIRRSRKVKYEQEQRPQQVNEWGWDDVRQKFVEVQAETLTVTLFFDSYEQHDTTGKVTAGATAAAWLQTGNPFATGDSTDVTKLTRPVAALAAVVPDLHHPPLCELSWGAYKSIFSGVLTRIDQKFTMFLPSGIPVRATMACTFTEYETRAHAKAIEMWSADVVKTRVVARGDTLHSLAAAEYDDPSMWRHIARANGITNPRALLPGTVLTIPKLAG